MDNIEVEAIAALGVWYERYYGFREDMPSLLPIFAELERLGCGRVWLQRQQSAIYALIDPRNHAIRYIGITKHPERRWSEHQSRQDDDNTRKRDWIIDLKSAGLRPIMKILEIVPEATARTREVAWIQVCKQMGFDLLNTEARPRQMPLLVDVIRQATKVGSPDGLQAARKRPALSQREREYIAERYRAGALRTAIRDELRAQRKDGFSNRHWAELAAICDAIDAKQTLEEEG